jgi:hypothetical protein
MPVPGLPLSSAGAPKRAAPWVAAAMFHLAAETDLLSASQAEPPAGAAAAAAGDGRLHLSFRIELEKGVGAGASGNAKMSAIARVLRLFMEMLGSRMKLDTWDAVRKHLTPEWWKNATKGGNKDRDFSQTYVENAPGSFAEQGRLLAEFLAPDGRSGVVLLREAVQRWHAETHSSGGDTALPPPTAVTLAPVAGGNVSVLGVPYALGAPVAGVVPQHGCWLLEASTMTGSGAGGGDGGGAPSPPQPPAAAAGALVSPPSRVWVKLLDPLGPESDEDVALQGACARADSHHLHRRTSSPPCTRHPVSPSQRLLPRRPALLAWPNSGPMPGDRHPRFHLPPARYCATVLCAG